jgi:hypothetical protein
MDRVPVSDLADILQACLVLLLKTAFTAVDRAVSAKALGVATICKTH